MQSTIPRNNGPLRAMVFDFDGTLAELTIDFEEMRRKVGSLAEVFFGARPEPGSVPVLEWLDELAARLERKSGRDEALELHCRGRLVVQAMELDAAKKGRLFSYARGVLDRLADRGLATAVITRNSTAAVKTVFPDIDKHCGVFLAREDVARAKPDPAHMGAALARLGVEATRTLMVGDHLIDIETGRRAGSLTAGVASGKLSRAELAEGSPDFLAGDLPELMGMLEDGGYLPSP